jgi:hypothetical protein
MSLKGEAAGVAATGGGVVAGGQPEVVVPVEGDVTADMATGPAVDLDLQDLLLSSEVQVRGGRLVQLEPGELEVALPGVPHARIGLRGRRRVPAGVDAGYGGSMLTGA